MGLEIEKIEFDENDYRQFRIALTRNLAQLEQVLANSQFGIGPRSLGAELEMYLIDDQCRPLFANQEIQSILNDPQLTLELNRYNLEYNLSPTKIAAGAFAATEREMLEKLREVRGAAAHFGGRVVPIGILPTLQKSDFGPHCITDRKRYHALVAQLLQRRGDTFKIDINGENPLQLEMSDITLEGANTSFQVHYRVDPHNFADNFNAIQLSTPLAIALGANSPSLFGHQLWHETRVPLFKQSIDTRQIERYGWNQPARVNFGQGWVRRGALELFREVARIYPPLLPICAEGKDENGVRIQGSQNLAPTLSELRLHQSTVWLWNRPIYDDNDGGHLRIEMRALPAGPTPIDMVANAAFLIGLGEGLRPDIEDLLPGLPFHLAEYNFYRAAQSGLDAQLLWPERGQSGYREQPLLGIAQRLLPIAQRGLHDIGVADEEAIRLLGVIEKRLTSGQTGAVWQRKKLAALQSRLGLQDALRALVEDYLSNSEANVPVAEWSL